MDNKLPVEHKINFHEDFNYFINYLIPKLSFSFNHLNLLKKTVDLFLCIIE